MLLQCHLTQCPVRGRRPAVHLSRLCDAALCALLPGTYHPRKIGALLLTFCGCVLVAGLFPAGVGSISAAAVLFGLGSGFGYALYSIFSKLALKRYSPSTITFYTFLFSALGSLPLSRLWEDASLLLDPRAILGGLGIGVLCCHPALSALYGGPALGRARQGRYSGHCGALCGRPHRYFRVS